MMASIGSLYIVKTVDRDADGRDRRRLRDVPATAATAAPDGVGRWRTSYDTAAR